MWLSATGSDVLVFKTSIFIYGSSTYFLVVDLSIFLVTFYVSGT